jgi:hypothetical protein
MTTATDATLEEFVNAYIECALWSSHDESGESGGDPLDSNYTPDDIHPDTLSKMRDDCALFLTMCGHIITRETCLYRGCSHHAYAGHDFWLTRNGHGCGFWDGDWHESVEKRLDNAAKQFGEANLYIGDDGKIHQA